MTESDDVLISRAVRLGDKTAFAELVRRYEQKVFLLLCRLTGERALAEDLAQETFLRAWQKLDTFRGSGSFGGWLASLAYNVFRAHWRRTKQQRSEVPIEDVEIGAPAADETGPADLTRLLAVLNPQDQVILTLTYAYGLSNTEVADVLGMPAGTVKARIHRAKARIRDRIDSAGPASGSVPADSGPAAQDTGRTGPVGRAPRRRFGHPVTPAGSLTC